MGKLTSFLTGAGQGALAVKRYEDSKKRMEDQDKLLRDVLSGNMKKTPEEDPMAAFADVPRTPVSGGDPLTEEERRKLNASGMANGGMVQPMPQHWDKMSWQRASFKK
jgi:hypothetical protein